MNKQAQEALDAWKMFFNLACEFDRNIKPYADVAADLLYHNETIRSALQAQIDGAGRQCGATVSSDPPMDCNWPLCGCDPKANKVIDALEESGILRTPSDKDSGAKFALGDRVRKIKGSSWQGVVVGFYSTTLTPFGYAVESERERGSVQIYPEAALEKMVEGAVDDKDEAIKVMGPDLITVIERAISDANEKFDQNDEPYLHTYMAWEVFDAIKAHPAVVKVRGE